MINTRAYLKRATFYVQNMQGEKNEARKEYADAGFARHNGSWVLEVQKRFCGGKLSIPEGLQQKTERKKGRENILDTLRVADI